MPLIVDELSVWDIGFRWAGYDPDRLWLRLPLSVKDNFRLLIDAILKGELDCISITLEKRHFDPDERELSAHYWLDDIYACIGGRYYNRKLLRWAQLERFDFKLWCDRLNVPLPEFWFPPGWNLEYELPEGHLPPGYSYYRRDWSTGDWAEWQREQDAMAAKKTDDSSQLSLNESELDQTSEAPLPPVITSPMADAANKMRPNQEAAIACRQIASVIWRGDETRTIASVVKDELIQKYGGGSHYNDDTVREWIKVVAPLSVRQKRGRPRKNGAEDE